MLPGIAKTGIDQIDLPLARVFPLERKGVGLLGQGQAEEVTENLAAQHGVDAIAGVQHQILSEPGHGDIEKHEHDEGKAKDDQNASALVGDDLVDDHLGKKRGGETHKLNG